MAGPDPNCSVLTILLSLLHHKAPILSPFVVLTVTFVKDCLPTKSSLELGRRAGVDFQSIGLCTVPPARSSPYRVTSWNRRIRAAAA